jgi:hypothetical protein
MCVVVKCPEGWGEGKVVKIEVYKDKKSINTLKECIFLFQSTIIIKVKLLVVIIK